MGPDGARARHPPRRATDQALLTRPGVPGQSPAVGGDWHRTWDLNFGTWISHRGLHLCMIANWITPQISFWKKKHIHTHTHKLWTGKSQMQKALHKNQSHVRYSQWVLFQLYGPQIWVGGRGIFLVFLCFQGVSQVPNMFPNMFSHFYPIYFAQSFSLSHPRGRHSIFQ